MKRLFIVMVGSFVFSGVPTLASSPDAWSEYYQKVTKSCLKASKLSNSQLRGKIISFSDIGYEALLVQGQYPQPHMNNQVGQMLCLFNQ
ncbi:MAG TPA: hypothetical protein V6C71_15575 [Coleofasciculaceae cyanobacterium]|jgi:hypothetical protein